MAYLAARDFWLLHKTASAVVAPWADKVKSSTCDTRTIVGDGLYRPEPGTFQDKMILPIPDKVLRRLV